MQMWNNDGGHILSLFHWGKTFSVYKIKATGSQSIFRSMLLICDHEI